MGDRAGDDAERARRSRAARRATDPGPALGSPSFLGQVMTAAPEIGKFLVVRPVTLTGMPVQGGIPDDAVGERDVVAAVWGPQVPASGERVGVHWTAYRWVVGKVAPGAAPPEEQCVYGPTETPYSLPATDLALTYHQLLQDVQGAEDPESYQGSMGEFAFNDCVADDGDYPFTLTYYETEPFEIGPLEGEIIEPPAPPYWISEVQDILTRNGEICTAPGLFWLLYCAEDSGFNLRAYFEVESGGTVERDGRFFDVSPFTFQDRYLHRSDYSLSPLLLEYETQFPEGGGSFDIIFATVTEVG
jgi:hypothetical protein